MTGFLLIGLVLASAAALAVAWPLWRASAMTASLAASTVALGSVALYLGLSQWDWAVPDHAPAAGQMEFAEVVQKLEQRLAQEPGDIDGWKMLGRTRTVLGEFALAQRAYARALELTGGEDPEAMVGYAEALAMTDESAIDGEAGVLFERAASLQPDNARALWYAGIVSYRRGSFELARERWTRLLTLNPPEQLQALLQERLAELDGRLGSAPASSATEAAPAAGIRVDVSLDPALTGRAAPDSTLYIIARRGNGGPPLAVVQRRAADLPLQLTLTDADAMLPGTQLTSGGALSLIARISHSGQPAAASGDLYGEVGYDFASTGPVSLSIRQVVP